MQSIKKQKIQEELEDKDDKEDKQGFGEDLKQAWYERCPLQNLRTNVLFPTDRVMLRKN